MLYELQNDTFGLPLDCSKEENEKAREYCQYLVQTFPAYKATLQEAEDKKISDSAYVRIINSRSPYLGKSLNPTLVYEEPSLASDEEDFWSFDTLGQFLGIAERRGVAVCQLLKKCSTSDLDNIINAIRRDTYDKEQLQRLFYSTKIEVGFWEAFSPTSDEILEELREKLVDQYIPIGTGFMVGKNYLLTNYHVLPDADEVKDFIARFRYDRDANDDTERPVDYYLDPSFFVASPELDYTLVKLFVIGDSTGKATIEQIEAERRKYELQFLNAGENFGWLPLSEDDALIAPPLSKEQVDELKEQLELDPDLLEKASKFGLPGEPVNIIQHPRGRAKEIVFYSNRVQKLTSKYLNYQADTDLGSSGSPVLNTQWQVVALHHAVLVEISQDDHEEIKPTVQGSIGIRISAIVEDLKDKIFENAQIKDFVENYVIQSGTEPHRGTIYILSGVAREEISALNKDFDETQFLKEVCDKIQTAEITAGCALKDYGYTVAIIPNQLPDGYQPDEGLNAKENLIKAWVNQRKAAKDLQLGDIAIELSMDAYTEKQQKTFRFWGVKVELSMGNLRQKMIENPSLRGIGIYYAGTRKEREQQAELLLKTVLNQKLSLKPNSRSKKMIGTVLPNRGVRSDETVVGAISRKDQKAQSLPGLPFCQDIGIPSFVLRLGFVTNRQDQIEVTMHSDAIAAGIAKGLLALGNNLSPVPVATYQPQKHSQQNSSKQYFLSF